MGPQFHTELDVTRDYDGSNLDRITYNTFGEVKLARYVKVIMQSYVHHMSTRMGALISTLPAISGDTVRLPTNFANCAEGGMQQITTWAECEAAGNAVGKNIGGAGGADDSTTQGYGHNAPGCYLQSGTTYFNPVGYPHTISCSSWANSYGGFENGACLCHQ